MPSKDWSVTQVVKVVDGDSVHLHLLADIYDLTEDLGMVLRTTRPWKCRLVIIDTPERGAPGYVEAGIYTDRWLRAAGAGLRAETYYRDSFGRMLVDLYVAGDRGNTLSQALLLEGYATYER